MYVTTSFVYDNPDNIVEFMGFLEKRDVLKYTLFCTSYDTIGRFSTVEKEDSWKKNMKFVKRMFPKVRLHTEIIMT